MVQYKCSNLHYPGDEKMHKNTQMKKRNRGTSKVGVIECDNHIKRVSYLQNTLMKKNQEEPKKLGYVLEI